VNTINNAQKSKIHVLKELLHLDDDHYRDLLFEGYRVRSCVHLSMTDAADFIHKLETWAYSAGVQCSRRKYDQYDGRSDMASAAQLRKIDVLWRQVSRQTTATDRNAALNKMVKRITGIDDIRWLEKRHVGKIINTIQIMLRQKEKEINNGNGNHGHDRAGGPTVFRRVSGPRGPGAQPRIGNTGHQKPAHASDTLGDEHGSEAQRGTQIDGLACAAPFRETANASVP
jgi:phage gp16-like protein